MQLQVIALIDCNVSGNNIKILHIIKANQRSMEHVYFINFCTIYSILLSLLGLQGIFIMANLF